MNSGASDKKWNEARELLSHSDFLQAVTAYEKLARQFPRHAPIWVEYGAAAAGAGQLELADRAWDTAAQLEPRNSEVLLKIGHQYQTLRQPEKARAAFEKAAAADPQGINPRMSLAIFFEQQHRLGEARDAVASCLAIDPRDDQALYYAAFLDRRENKLEDAERRLRDLIASGPRHQYVQYASRYELAEVLNRTGRFDEAMQMLAEGKKIVRPLANLDDLLKEYDEIADRDRRSTRGLPKDILRVWGREFPERSREAMPKLAFLGGHPRSGTTLLEQILDAIQESPRWMNRRLLSPSSANCSTLRRQFPPSASMSFAVVISARCGRNGVDVSTAGCSWTKTRRPPPNFAFGCGFSPNCAFSSPCGTRATWSSVVIFRTSRSIQSMRIFSPWNGPPGIMPI